MSITLFVFVIGGLFFFGDDILHCSAHYFSADTSTIRLSAAVQSGRLGRYFVRIVTRRIKAPNFAEAFIHFL